MSQSLVVQERVLALNQQYMTAAREAHTSLTPDADLEAASLAPTIFLQNPDDFEATADAIIHHLEEALKKAASSEDEYRTRRSAQELFYTLIYFVEFKIAQIRHENDKSWWTKFKEKFSKGATTVISSVGTLLSSSGLAAAGGSASATAAAAGGWAVAVPVVLVAIAPDAVDLLLEYLEKRLRDWQINQQEYYFYCQLGTFFQKIQHSRCYSRDHSLLSNTWERTKEPVLSAIVSSQGLAAAINMIDLDETPGQRQRSAQIIANALIVRRDWPCLLDLAAMMKAGGYANYPQVKREILAAYQRSHAPDYNNNLGCGLAVVFAVFLLLQFQLEFWVGILAGVVGASVLVYAIPYAVSFVQYLAYRQRLQAA